MEKINLYLASEYEYRLGLAHRMVDEGLVQFCLTDYLPYREKPSYDKRIETIDVEACTSCDYEKVVDLNELPAVGKDLLEQMLPYESTAIHMGMRATNYPIAEYENEKRNYLRHLRFWNYILDKHNINFIVHHCCPHSQMKYVIYGLAKVKGIPMLIWQPEMFFSGLRFYGPDLDSIGCGIKKTYEQLADIDAETIQLNDEFAQYYEDKMDISHIDAMPNIIAQRNERKRIAKSLFERYSFFPGEVRKQKKMLKSILTSRTENQSFCGSTRLQYIDVSRNVIMSNYYRRYLQVKLEKYDTFAEGNPDFGKKYIYYALQLMPEASVIPLAGVFAEQYNSIQLLARIAKMHGVWVYVKEHYVQPSRSCTFYEDIRKIPNVVLIRSTVSAKKLIYHSIATASQTGSCILEGVLLGKPALGVGGRYFCKGLPGCFCVNDEMQGSKIVEEILKNRVVIDSNEIKKYFYAMQVNSIHEMTNEEANKYTESGEQSLPNRPEGALDERIELIKHYINMNYS